VTRIFNDVPTTLRSIFWCGPQRANDGVADRINQIDLQASGRERDDWRICAYTRRSSAPGWSQCPAGAVLNDGQRVGARWKMVYGWRSPSTSERWSRVRRFRS